MTARVLARSAVFGFTAVAVYAYLAQLRYERSFYRRYLLETGKDPNHG